MVEWTLASRRVGAIAQYILCFLHKFSVEAEGRSREGAATITTDNAANTLELVEGGRKRSHAKTITHAALAPHSHGRESWHHGFEGQDGSF